MCTRCVSKIHASEGNIGGWHGPSEIEQVFSDRPKSLPFWRGNIDRFSKGSSVVLTPEPVGHDPDSLRGRISGIRVATISRGKCPVLTKIDSCDTRGTAGNAGLGKYVLEKGEAMNTDRALHKRNGGFTSVEIGVTLVLIGLTLAFGVARIDTSSWSLDAAAQEVSQRVTAARAMAVLRQHDVIVDFDVATRAMAIHEDTDSDGMVDEDERLIRYVLDGRVEFLLGDASPLAGFTSAPITFAGGSVTFLRNGSASEEGAVYVGRPDVGKVRAIVIRRATGYAEVHLYNGARWLDE